MNNCPIHGQNMPDPCICYWMDRALDADRRIVALETGLSECVTRLYNCAKLLQDTIPDNEVWCEPCGLGDQVDATLDRAEALLKETT